MNQNNYTVLFEDLYIMYIAISFSFFMCMRQSRKVIWDMINTLFLTLSLSNLLLLLSFSTCKHTSVVSPAILSIFFEENSELKTTHNSFQYCHVHFSRQPFSKWLYTFSNYWIHLSHDLMQIEESVIGQDG